MLMDVFMYLPRASPGTVVEGKYGVWPWPDMSSMAALWLAALVAMAPSLGADPKRPDEYEVKVAYLYNFVRFVEWPSDDPEKAPQRESELGPYPLHLCTLKEDPFGESLDRLAGQEARGRGIVVLRNREVEEVAGCHLLFIARSEPGGLEPLLTELGGRGILTVGEQPGFAAAGGMIGFVVDHARVGLEINPMAVRKAGLRLSSKLLEVATLVDSAPHDDSAPHVGSEAASVGGEGGDHGF